MGNKHVAEPVSREGPTSERGAGTVLMLGTALVVLILSGSLLLLLQTTVAALRRLLPRTLSANYEPETHALWQGKSPDETEPRWPAARSTPTAGACRWQRKYRFHC